MPESLNYLDPKTLTKISRLDLKARLIVEGFISGLHKSPYHGFSVEFAQHREYTPGDEIKHLDWKVYGKTDRYYIKQYEEETNLACHMLLDTSESMTYKSRGNISKLEYGCYIVVSLAYLLLEQRDAVSLVTFDNKIQKNLRRSSSPAQLRTIISELNDLKNDEKTNMRRIFHELAEKITKRGMIVIISDFFDDMNNVIEGIRHFRYNKHEVILFHLLDRDEHTFPFLDLTMFDGLEGITPIKTDPRALREAYLKEVKEFTEGLKKECRNNNVDYVLVNTSDTLDHVLSAYLAARLKK